MRDSLATDITLPALGEPAWSERIDRWNQLDEISYCFCEALHRWQLLREFPEPDVILLASPGASNIADQDFAAGGAMSPAKFVFTLPNIAASVILQMLEKTGKVYCLQQGEETLIRAQREAHTYAQAGQTVWVFSSPPKLTENARTVQFHCIRALTSKSSG